MRYTFSPADRVWYATDLRLDAKRGMLQWTGGRGQDALLVRTPYGVDPEAMADALCDALSRTELREGRFTELLSASVGASGAVGASGPVGAFGVVGDSGRGDKPGGMADSATGVLPPGTAARLVSALERAKRNGCPIDGEARTYTVFACRTVAEAGPGGGSSAGAVFGSSAGAGLGSSAGAGSGSNAGPGGGSGIALRDGIRVLYGHQRGEISSPRCDVPLRLRVDVEAVERRGLARFAPFAGDNAAYYRISFPPRCPEGYRDGDLEYCIDDFAVPVTRRMLEAGSVYVRTDLRPRVVSRAAGLELEGG